MHESRWPLREVLELDFEAVDKISVMGATVDLVVVIVVVVSIGSGAERYAGQRNHGSQYGLRTLLQSLLRVPFYSLWRITMRTLFW